MPLTAPIFLGLPRFTASHAGFFDFEPDGLAAEAVPSGG